MAGWTEQVSEAYLRCHLNPIVFSGSFKGLFKGFFISFISLFGYLADVIRRCLKGPFVLAFQVVLWKKFLSDNIFASPGQVFQVHLRGYLKGHFSDFISLYR